MRTVKPSAVLLIPLLLGACELPPLGDERPPAPQRIGPAQARAAEAQLGQLRAKWHEAVGAGDVAAVAGLYAENAVMVTPDGQVLEGREAIQTGLPLGALAGIRLLSTGQEVGGDVASDMGTFRHTSADTAAAPSGVAGRYLMVLRLQRDGVWRIAQHVAAPVPELVAVDTAGAAGVAVVAADTAPARPEPPPQRGPRILGTPIPPGNR